jgi:hypothetical protein
LTTAGRASLRKGRAPVCKGLSDLYGEAVGSARGLGKAECRRQSGTQSTGCEEKVMMRIDCCSSGIHAATPHLDSGDVAGIY